MDKLDNNEFKSGKVKKNLFYQLRKNITHLHLEKDLRVRKKKNQEVTRTLIKEIASKGYVRTHAFVTNLVLDFFSTGEIKQKTQVEITDELPWQWDMTSLYLNSLAQERIISFRRNSNSQKVCFLNTEDILKEKPIETCQISNLINYYKIKGLENSNIEISEIYSIYLDYYSKLRKLIKLEKNISDLVPKIQLATNTEMDLFINDLTNFYLNRNLKKIDFEGIEQTFNQQPLLIYSLKRGTK